MAGDEGVYQTAAEVTQVIMDCLASDLPPIRMRISQWSKDFAALKTQADPDGRKLQARVARDIAT